MLQCVSGCSVCRLVTESELSTNDGVGGAQRVSQRSVLARSSFELVIVLLPG